MKSKNIRDYTNDNTGEVLPQPRGFRPQQLVTVYGEGEDRVQVKTTYYVRLGYRASQCNGEAHSNAHIDHCMVCLKDTWGVVVRKL